MAGMIPYITVIIMNKYTKLSILTIVKKVIRVPFVCHS